MVHAPKLLSGNEEIHYIFCTFEQNFVRASSNLLDMTNQQEWFNIQKV